MHAASNRNKYLDFCVIKAFYKDLESSKRKIQITIFLENYQLPLKLMNNGKLNAREDENVTISKENLLVTHVSAKESEIQFSVTKSPQFGKITDDTGKIISQFTQADIIHSAVFYKNTQPAMVDVLTLNATNHFSTISNIVLSVRIELRKVLIDHIYKFHKFAKVS